LSRDIEVVAGLGLTERPAARELLRGATAAGIVNVRAPVQPASPSTNFRCDRIQIDRRMVFHPLTAV
jgi:hypothetical protein